MFKILKLNEADDEEIKDNALEDLENQEEIEDIVNDEIEQEENPIEEESELDKELDELRDVLVDLDLRLYQIIDKEDTNKVEYIIGKVAENSNDILMLIDKDYKEEDDIEDQEIENIDDTDEDELKESVDSKTDLDKLVQDIAGTVEIEIGDTTSVFEDDLINCIYKVIDEKYPECEDKESFWEIVYKELVKDGITAYNSNGDIVDLLKESVDDIVNDTEEIENRFDFVKLPIKLDEVNQLYPRYGEELTPDHEAIMNYLMNCLIEINPDRANELQSDEEDFGEEPLSDIDNINLDDEEGEQV